MLVFTPKTNSTTNVCEGIEQYSASRPPPSLAYAGTSVFFFVMITILWSVSAIAFYRLRNSPRFQVVRPFSLNMILAGSNVFFSVGAALNLAIPNLPCVVLMFSVVLGVAGIGVNIFCRLLVYVVEAQFASRTNQFTARLNESGDDGASSAAASRKSLLSISKLRALLAIAKVATGFSTVEQVSVEELSKVRRMYDVITLSVVIPATLPVLIFLAVTPQYQTCTGCAIFLDLIFLTASGILFYFLCIRVLYVAWRLDFPDVQGLFKELVWIAGGFGLPSFFAALLIVFDPNGAAFRREFAFEWIADAFMLVFWYVSAGSQIYAAYKDNLRYGRFFQKRGSRSSFSSSMHDLMMMDATSSFLGLLVDNESLQKEFEEYTTRQFAVENLYFVLDVAAYKKFFSEKANTWRRLKARTLFETYIKHEAVLEINVSEDCKARIKNKLSAVLVGVDEEATKFSLDDFVTLFDEAVGNVERDILRDIWIRFQSDRRKSSSGTTTPRTTMMSLTRATASGLNN